MTRDQGCRFPRCDRSPDWCDAHHITHWASGGSTALGNLILLCRPHHRLVHDRFRIQVVDGRIRFTRADGSIVDDRASPD